MTYGIINNIGNPVERSKGSKLRCARVRRSKPGEKKKIVNYDKSIEAQTPHTRTHTTPARSQAPLYGLPMVRHDRRPPCSLVRHCYYARGGTGLYYGPLANQTLGTPSPPPPSRGPHAIGPEPGPPATGATRAHTRTRGHTDAHTQVRSNVRIYLSSTHAHATKHYPPLSDTHAGAPRSGGGDYYCLPRVARVFFFF